MHHSLSGTRLGNGMNQSAYNLSDLLSPTLVVRVLVDVLDE